MKETRARSDAGFTVVEILVALVVAMLILAAGSQLYSLTQTSSGSAQRRAKASNMAYDLMRQAQQTAPAPCPYSTPNTTTVALPDPTALPGATASQTISCPYASTNPNLSLITITVNYNNPEPRSVVRAIVTGI